MWLKGKHCRVQHFAIVDGQYVVLGMTHVLFFSLHSWQGHRSYNDIPAVPPLHVFPAVSLHCLLGQYSCVSFLSIYLFVLSLGNVDYGEGGGIERPPNCLWGLLLSRLGWAYIPTKQNPLTVSSFLSTSNEAVYKVFNESQCPYARNTCNPEVRNYLK